MLNHVQGITWSLLALKASNLFTLPVSAGMIFYVMVSVPRLNKNSCLHKFEMVYKDCFMPSVHISSYGCTQEVFQEQERNVKVKAQLRATPTS